MRRIYLAGLLSLVAVSSAAACELRLEDGWVRGAPPGAKAMAGFGRIVNSGTVESELVSLSSPAFGRIEIHEMKTVDGVMQMRKIERLTLQPGESMDLASGGNHIMLFDPTEPLATGAQFDLTMTLGCDSKVVTLIPVLMSAPAASGKAEPADAKDAHEHHH